MFRTGILSSRISKAFLSMSILSVSITANANCLLSDVGNILCTSYDFTAPININTNSRTSPSLYIHTNIDATNTTALTSGISTGISNTASGTITSAASLNIRTPLNSGGGAIETYYGIYIGNPTVATNNYSIYSQGGNNYFGGNLEVTGTIKATNICDENGLNCKLVSDGWSAGSVSSIDTGAGLTGGPITSTGTIAVDVGTTANKIVQLNGSAQLPAVSGANLTNINAATISGQTLSVSSPASGQALSYNGTNWVNKSLGTSDISGLTTALGSKLDAANMPASCDANQTLTFTSPTGSWNCSNILLTPASFGSHSQNLVLASPPGASGTPTFRTLTLADLPSGIGGGSWTTSGSDIYRPSGKVGIGTTTPNATLDVNGTIRATQLCDETGANCKTLTGGWAPKIAVAEVEVSESKAIPGTNVWTKIPLGMPSIAANMNVDIWNFKTTATIPGYYRYSLTSKFTATGSSSTVLSVGLYKNGVLQRQANEHVTYTTALSQTITTTGVVYLNNSSDYIEGFAKSSPTAVSVPSDSTATSLTMELLLPNTF